MKKRLVLSLALSFALLGVGVNGTGAQSLTNYTIQSGETFWTLSQKFKLDMNQLIAANPDQNPNNLYAGLVIKLPIASTTYTVLAGETFWTISQKLKVELQQLIDANPNVQPNNVYAGLVLNIPGTSAPTSTSTPTTKATTTTYIIQSGDTFWTLAQRFGVPYNDIVAANPTVNPMNLYPGLTVQIPQKTAEAVKAPTYLADGQFPLRKGSYTPFDDNYGDGRGFDSMGNPTRKHEGVDVIAEKGTPIYSAYDGVVTNKGWNTLGGWRLTVRTPDGKYALYYAHLSRYASNVEVGTRITKGQLIGYVGDTGYGPEGTSGQFVAHLHVGIYDIANGFTPVNPFQHLKYWESRL
ncbi:LysM peptidoglycan-binding domain-containing M23 family metallopeptidase [Ammoniphilus sp. YIM 78166]|uniref:LysM peptidoglycan-binding domain-containing M23 family metallopeptidase n=1 Tax=Ammoniphilus sp. YIM 78166 TaxID=1644106 RepID=UPI00106F94D9|nr:LysM peptidoglycan-binding domain-containing protein [Ammoniphilus sp. YIM 78166]